MFAERSSGMRWGISGNLCLALLSGAWLAAPGVGTAQSSQPTVGLVCTWGRLAGTVRTFNLSTATGYIALPDGNTAFMWGFSEGGAAFQHPSPVLCANQGETVEIFLRNTFLKDDVSIIFPGQEGVLANGAPAQPQVDVTGKITSLTSVAASGGGSVTYRFLAGRSGTFLYESGTEPTKQVRMGLFGALVVRPTTPTGAGVAQAYTPAASAFDSQFTPGEEFLVLLSEIDPYQNAKVEQGRTFNLNNYHPRYWLVNGRGFPDSIADNFASWLPSQPYGALARIHPHDERQALPGGAPNQGYHPHPGLIRYLSVGTENFPFHPHGNNGLVIGRDGHPLTGSGGEDLTFEKFAVNVGPGQTWDVTFRWYDAEGYTPATFPVTLPSLADVQIGMFYSGSPFLGLQAPPLPPLPPLPPGVTTLNQCGEYYIISHNHALYQITSWGVVMTGPITYVRVDPPLPNTCP